MKDIYLFSEFYKIYEKDEVQDEKDEKDDIPSEESAYKIGDIVQYKTKKYDPNKEQDKQGEGAIAEGEIKKVRRGGKVYIIYNNNIKEKFRKRKEDILSKVEKDNSIEDGAIVMGNEKELLEKIYSNRVFKFGNI